MTAYTGRHIDENSVPHERRDQPAFLRPLQGCGSSPIFSPEVGE
jgi:hypothetical protein